MVEDNTSGKQPSRFSSIDAAAIPKRKAISIPIRGLVA
jgi:hypothetical protein